MVTGASTGIGAATALHLRDLGFSVLAGVRRDQDAERLRDGGLTPIRLDVTDPEQLTAARDEVGNRPLAGPVNNAGISHFGPLEFVRTEELRLQFEVNVVGQVAATQAFIGGLRAGYGRIVNVGSISGRLATPMIGPYGPPELAQRYGPMIKTALEFMRRIDRQTGLDASAVAKVIGKALTAQRPHTRYLVGRDACLQAAMAKLLPDRLIDRLLLSLVKC